MSKKITNKKTAWGGMRNGAGRPKTGETKSKICVSGDQQNWQAAKAKWKDKSSRLVDWLVSRYVASESPGQQTGVAT